MAETGIRTGFDRAIRMICVIALVLLGLAHRPPVPAIPVLDPSEVARLILPDGTLPELCLPGTDQDGKSKTHTAASDCEACRISAAIALPAPADLVGIRLPVAIAAVLPQPAEAHYRQLFPPNSAPRAPPILT
ncbi:hypothetical protein DMY87_22405 [Rhizobium wuzhouense]|uniref:DUF2946 domain-containing protein n=2 Tax=Rhizobium wuzhouense TaxID=1986026 RepID=A0ABX5NQH4_9HYPH|nr:hypothetical protein [Rhizobium sp. AG855]PYB70036.1 hypothetical protein DMY87_22405 [Rhizobium wuzhouense]RKE78281.1 hypothetical protein DFO46_4450 [Rhizobium sp. AG855]